MLEFLKSIWSWVLENKDAIVTTVTSANFVSIVGAITIIIRTNKQNKKNMALSENLSTTLCENKSLTKTINNIDVRAEDNSIKITELQEVTKVLLEKINNFEDKICSKTDAVIEALQTAWSTIKDDNIRTTVAGILTNARYKETNRIEEMKAQMEELKRQLLEQSEQMKQQVVDTVDEAKVVIEAKSNDIKTVSRV